MPGDGKGGEWGDGSKSQGAASVPPPEAGRDTLILDLQLLDLEHISAVSSHPVCGLLLW